MSVYLTEEEQIERIKVWWKQNGGFLVIGILTGCLVVTVWQAWQNHQGKTRYAASSIYQSLMVADKENKTEQRSAEALKLIHDYPKTPYASMASLMLAKQAVIANRIPEAIEHLQFVMSHDTLSGFKQIAAIRLARLYSSQKQYDAALALLEKNISSAFTPISAELRGDIYAAMGKTTEAQQAYESALSSLQKDSLSYRLVEMKLQDMHHVLT